MKVSNLVLSALFVSSFIFIGCSSSGGSSSEPIVGSTTVTAVDGYIKDANITDNAGQVGVYTSNGRYTFANSIAYPLRSRGGVLEDTNASFDINMSAQSGLVLSPITAFLENNSTLLDKLIVLGLDDAATLGEFSVDYVDTNNSDLAKLSQLLYLVQKDAALLSVFQTSLENANPSSLNEIFTLAEADVNATMGGYGVTYRAFLSSVLALTVSPSEYETQLESAKAALSEIQYHGTTYGTVVSPSSGRVWLDRNLGASKVCEDLNETACFGDYYQWGRNFDGHQISTSELNTTLSQVIDNLEHSSFIVPYQSPDDWAAAGIDDNGTLRETNWSKSDGTSVCPAGFRVPTINELRNDTADVNGTVSAFNNFLKLPSAGFRWYGQYSGSERATVNYQGAIGIVWTNTPDRNNDGTLSRNFAFYIDHIDDTNIIARANGFNVRCIKDIENQTPIANAGLDKNVTQGVEVRLNASLSSDVDGSIVSYVWSEGDTNLSTAISFPKSDFSAGTHTITLTVTDNDGATSTDTVVVTVNASILHNGILYGTVTSPYTTRVWLDRNLGASQACTAINDTHCYGDYYQWGRGTDGHQIATSATTTTLATDFMNAGTDFILSNNGFWNTDDATGILRSLSWSKSDGSSICPAGYRVPTITELENETILASTPVADRAGAFSNFLKLPSSGIRNYSTGALEERDGDTTPGSILWSSSVNNGFSSRIYFGENYFGTNDYNPGFGYPVRCIQNRNNIALNTSVTALTNVVSGTPSNVTDGNYSTVWYSWESSLSISFVIDLGSVYQIEALSFLPSQTRTYTIESSTNNVDWTQQHSGTANFSGATIQDIITNPSYNARYLRYTGSNASGDVAYVGVIEFEVYGTLLTDG
ncbi:MAG: FISUMP domain-containing protein [Sulfurimonas sp.]|nr:FISUMP domain-containing protein [Sulfurimonas sp.]